MRRWGVQDRGDDVAVVVSELLTNALRHAVPQARAGAAGGPQSLAGPPRAGQAGPLRAVRGGRPQPPAAGAKEPDYLAESGRGLHVIDALSDRWGCTAPTEAGKVVWALFSVHLDQHQPDLGWFARARPEPARSAV